MNCKHCNKLLEKEIFSHWLKCNNCVYKVYINKYNILYEIYEIYINNNYYKLVIDYENNNSWWTNNIMAGQIYIYEGIIKVEPSSLKDKLQTLLALL